VWTSQSSDTSASEPGDEVIVPTLSFIARANAVTYYADAEAIFVDSDEDKWNLDP
jgi:perosamine synthetase